MCVLIKDGMGSALGLKVFGVCVCLCIHVCVCVPCGRESEGQREGEVLGLGGGIVIDDVKDEFVILEWD